MQLSYVKSSVEARQHAAELANQPVLGVDIETTGLDPLTNRVRLLAAATLSGRIVVFDMFHVSWDSLQPICGVGWVCHNASFEWRHLTYAGLTVPPLHDSMLLDRLVSHHNRKLDEVAADHLGLQLDKTLQVSNWSAPDMRSEQIEYCGADALATVRIAQELLPQVDKAGQRRLYDLWRQAIPMLAGLTLRGQSFDWDTHSKLIDKWTAEKKTLTQQLQQHLGGINYNSGPQIGDWLKENLPAATLKTWPKTASGRLSTAADTLELHAKQPMIQPLLRYKVVQKLLSTYGLGWQKNRHPVTGNLHPEFSLGMTVSGRLACSKPNTQNPPRLTEFRQLFVPPSGQVLIGADFSQIELRVAALLSGDWNMLDAYRKGEDLHTKTAAAIAGCAVEAVTVEQRQGAKPVNFGNLYGQAAAGLARQANLDYGVGMTTADATQALLKFKLAYPQLEHWKRQHLGLAQQQRQVKTKLGLVRDFDRQHEGYLRGEAQNMPVQGSAAEVLLASLVRLPAALAGTDAVLYHTVHDEIELACSPGFADRVAAELRGVMMQGFLDVFPEGEALTHKLVDVKAGSSWAELK